MRKPRTSDEIHEPDTVFGTGLFTPEDDAAIQKFIAETRNSPENQAAIAAMKQREQQAPTAAKKVSSRKPSQLLT